MSVVPHTINQKRTGAPGEEGKEMIVKRNNFNITPASNVRGIPINRKGLEITRLEKLISKRFSKINSNINLSPYVMQNIYKIALYHNFIYINIIAGIHSFRFFSSSSSSLTKKKIQKGLPNEVVIAESLLPLLENLKFDTVSLEMNIVKSYENVLAEKKIIYKENRGKSGIYR
jgi:hypothetical protein